MKSQSCVKLSQLSQDFLPHFLQNGPVLSQKTTVVKKRLLVFNDNGQSKHIAILRIWNPTTNSDVFYKLTSDGCKQNFHVKSWKGRVPKNSHVDVTIVANVKGPSSSKNSASEDDELPVLLLSQLCQCKFNLEMTECVTKWRAGGTSQRSEHNMVKMELICVTREILLQIQSETTLNMDNVSESCHDIEQRIAKFVQSSMSNEIAQSHSPGTNCEETFNVVPLKGKQQALAASNEVADYATKGNFLENGDEQQCIQPVESAQSEPESLGPYNQPTTIISILMLLFMVFVDMAFNVLTTWKQFARKVLQFFGLSRGLQPSLTGPAEKVTSPSELD